MGESIVFRDHMHCINDKYSFDTFLEERISKGPLAIIECFEEIPCDPCRNSCFKNAISFDKSITSIPKLDIEKCSGCGICVAKCPGMAIFIADGSYSDDEGLVSLPYEFLPLPNKGQSVKATDRYGRVLCNGEIYKVKTSSNFDCTAVVTIKIPKEFIMEARDFILI